MRRAATMPFGKHQGEAIRDLPFQYLQWLLTIDLSPWLRKAVEDAINGGDGIHEDDASWFGGRAHKARATNAALTKPPLRLRQSVADIITRGFRVASMKAHPDKGGSNEEMILLQEAREWLQTNLIGE